MELVVKVFGKKVVEATLTVPVGEKESTEIVDSAVKKMSFWWTRRMTS